MSDNKKERKTIYIPRLQYNDNLYNGAAYGYSPYDMLDWECHNWGDNYGDTDDYDCCDDAEDYTDDDSDDEEAGDD